jgi:hypothetical protein
MKRLGEGVIGQPENLVGEDGVHFDNLVDASSS